MPHGQVVVSKCDSIRESMAEVRSVVGPQSTVDLCASTSSTDPWLVKDPWQKAVLQVPQPSCPPTGPNVTSQLQEIEDRLAKSILEKLPSDRMETDETEQRIHMLEQQVQHLAGRHQALECTVTEHHHQNTAQMQSLQAQMMSQMEDPAVVPSTPPGPEVACLLCEAFQCEVPCLERHLASAKKSTRVAKHASNPNMIYKDTRRPLPEPVTGLLNTFQAVITEVDPDDVAVDFEPEVTFDASKPVLVDDKPVQTIHVADNRLYLEDVSSAAEHGSVKQVRPVGALENVFAAFHEQWKQRWCKHDAIPSSHWSVLVDFAKSHMPCHPVLPLDITPALMCAKVAAKKPHAATGPDGVSRPDILQSDDVMLSSLCNVHKRAEQDGSWPLQVLTGRVASLAKREGAAGTQDYRPITIFSMLYRAYSSLQARLLLNNAAEWSHPDIHGNRKHHQTAHLWRTIVTSIQQAYDQNACLSGLTADIEKCYNCLPRWPILAAAVQSGTPQSTMQAWTGALAAMVRRFKVRDSFSDGFTTSTGLAEGCALSCFGMLLLDDVMHRWVALQYPTIRPLSFVDNWDFLTWDPDAAVHQLDALLRFTELADLTVDRAKTFAWSTHANIRQRLRASGIAVKHHAKDLGAHVAMSKQRTNSTVTGRLQALAPLWQQLKSSSAGYHAKLRALRTVAWPRSLLAIESAPVNSSTWLTHRRQAVQALRMDKAGVNPLLLLGLVEVGADPNILLWSELSLKLVCTALWIFGVRSCRHMPLDFCLVPRHPLRLSIAKGWFCCDACRGFS
eukprot:s1629_g7.t1